MTVLKPELESTVKTIFKDAWSEQNGHVVPEPKDLTFGNDGKHLDATVLYADIASSTGLVNSHATFFAAEVYKTFLACAAKIIKDQKGVITAYDGDRVMGVFLGDEKNNSAVRAGLRINTAVMTIIQPALVTQYPSLSYQLKHVVGIDTSDLLVSKIGVRNDDDLVWVGRAANYAAKLCALDSKYQRYITDSVYAELSDVEKIGVNTDRNEWTPLTWTTMNGIRIYASNAWWTII
jgi:class 3 adenylate cyclase